MRRLPVIATIREAYQFTFANLGAIMGLIWFPMVLYTVGEFFISQHYGARVSEAIAAGNPNAAGPAVLALFLFVLVTLGLYAMMFAAVAQLSLGQRLGGAMFHFSFGALEWRIFRNLFGVTLFLLPAYLLLVLAIGQAGTGGAPTAQAGVAVLISLLLSCAIIYFAVRLTALLLPVILSDDKSVFVRAWSLTAGNFWRLLGLFLGVTLPVYLVMLFAMAAIIGPGVTPGAMPTPEEVQALSNANRPLIAGLSFLVAPLMVGLTVSASVFAWRTLSKTDITA